jgi:hypothetical protein
MSGRHKVMQKPVNPHDLMSTIQGMLDKAGSMERHDKQLICAPLAV